MLSKERRMKIHELIVTKGSITTEELENLFNVSRMTIWRDLKILEEQGIISRVHGGAMKIQKGDPNEREFLRRRETASEEKRAISQYAAQNFIEPSDVIFLDGGTTVIEMIPHLTDQNLTLLTNGLNTLVLASQYMPELNVIGCGGLLRIPSYNFVGPGAEESFRQYKVNTAFISGTGFTLENGVMDPHPLEMQIKRIACNNANKIVVLMDSKKYNKNSLSTCVTIEEIDVLITASNAPSEFINSVKKRGVDVRIVSL
ncbi:MAG: putative transcriptional regulator [Promethearchaeota archaeon]|nr:MAG: putative transcriptional regulator [Candidatus Lokiarchaeota archaeon]